MIRLDLTLQQADWLKQHLLDPALATAAQRASLLSQLAQAYEHATAILTCPVCNASFNRLRRGRGERNRR